MVSQVRTRPVTVELWTRSLSPRGAGKRRSVTIRRLERLEDGGRIDGFRVRLWGDRIGHSTPEARTERGRTALERVADFRSWAEQRDLSLSPFFEERTRESSLAGEREPEPVQVLPVMAVAEFRAGEIYRVTPCADGQRAYAVEDHLAALSADEPVAAVPPDPVVASPGRE